MQVDGHAIRQNEPWFDTLVELLEPDRPARLPHPEAPSEPATWRERIETGLQRLAPLAAAMRPAVERTSRGFELALSGLVIAYLAMVTVDLTGERVSTRRTGPVPDLDRVAVTAHPPHAPRPDLSPEPNRPPSHPERIELPTLGGIQPLPDDIATPPERVPPLTPADRHELLADLEADQPGALARRSSVALDGVPGRLSAAALREAVAADLEVDGTAGRALAIAAAEESARRARQIERHERALRLVAAEEALERDRLSLEAARRDGLTTPPVPAEAQHTIIIAGPLEDAAVNSPEAPPPEKLTREQPQLPAPLPASANTAEETEKAAEARKKRREQAEEAARKRQEARKIAARQRKSRPKPAQPAAAPAPAWSTLFPTAQQ